jgi:hypothetical protein
MTNRELIFQYVGKDDEIDFYDFEDYLKKEVGTLLSSVPVKIDTFEPEMKRVRDLVFQLRGETVRPGFGSSLTNEKFRNNPLETDLFEELDFDSIPFTTYKKMALDPQIIMGLFLLKGWIGGLSFDIQTSDRQTKAIVEHVLGSVWSQLVRDLVDAVIYGFQFGEKVWFREEVELEDPLEDGKDKTVYSGKIVGLKKVKFLDPDQDFKYFKDKNDEISYVTQRQRRGEVKVERSKLVWFALDQTHSGIFGRSRLKACYTTWYYCQITHQYLLRDNEQRGAPHLEIRYPRGSTVIDGSPVGNDELAVELGGAVKSTGVALLPSDIDEKGNYKWTIKYADNKQGQDSSPFMDYLRYGDVKKLSALGIPSAVLGDATFGQADAQSDMLLVIIEDIVSQIENVIQRDIVSQIVEYNFGPKQVSKVKLKIDRSSLGRKKLFKEILVNMIRTGSSIPGYEPKIVPSVPGLCDDLAIPVEEFTQAFRPSSNPGRGAVDDLTRIEDSNGIDRINPTDRSDNDRKNSGGIID